MGRFISRCGHRPGGSGLDTIKRFISFCIRRRRSARVVDLVVTRRPEREHPDQDPRHDESPEDEEAAEAGEEGRSRGVRRSASLGRRRTRVDRDEPRPRVRDLLPVHVLVDVLT